MDSDQKFLPSAMTESGPIEIRVANKQAFIWDVDDIIRLRSSHHICGILTGTLPQLSQQNFFLGPPLNLMPEEVVLLVENKLAVLIDDPRAYMNPSKSQLQNWHSEECQKIKRQLMQTEVKDDKRSVSEEALQKRKERELRRKAIEAANVDKNDKDNIMRTSTPVYTQSSASLLLYSVTIPASSVPMPWYHPEERKYDTINDAKDTGIWDYPKTLHERAKCAVFKGLWEQGYFLGGGIKFGADYLVYPGDPLRYHSHFAASVLDSHDSTLEPMEIVAHGRLGTATKKSHLLCTWDDDKKVVSYLSIEWSGFG